MDPTKYGSKSSENKNKRHFFRWGEEGPGNGIGTCKYCSCKMKFKEAGVRGGKERAYAKKGSTSYEVGKEPQCITRPESAIQVSAGKSPKKSGSTAKKGSKKSAAKSGNTKKGAKKGGTRKKSAPRNQTKKPASTPTAPATETTSAA